MNSRKITRILIRRCSRIRDYLRIFTTHMAGVVWIHARAFPATINRADGTSALAIPADVRAIITRLVVDFRICEKTRAVVTYI